MTKIRKYEPETLIAMFRLAAELRMKMKEVGFTDNGGAIHSAERILHLLGLRLCFPDLSHLNNLRKHARAPFSEAALLAHEAGERVLIEHINPHRALTRLAIDMVNSGADNAEFCKFVEGNYQLALLTEDETTRLNKLNRTSIEPDRLDRAGIKLAPTGGSRKSTT